MQTRTRIFAIDILRALAIIGVLVIHTLARFLGPTAINETWNYLEFVVITFVVCSGYVNWLSFQNNKKKSLLAWYSKRFVRLYVPYVLYVAAVYVLTHSFSPASLTLTGGIDVGWLTLLFMQLALITPVYIWFTGNSRRNIFSLIFIGMISLIVVFFPIAPIYSRVAAWIPWSFVYLLGMNVAKIESTQKHGMKYYVAAFGLAAIVWLALAEFLRARGSTLTFTLHKYPPDLFYLSYGIAATGALLFLVTLFEKVFAGMHSVVMFFSKHSYGMFFLHLLILNFLLALVPRAHVIGMIAASVALTSIGMWLWDCLLLYKESRLNA